MVEPSELWDRWRAALRVDPRISAETFVAALDGEAETLGLLRTLIELDHGIAPSALVDIDPPSGEPIVFAGFRLIRPLGQGSAGIVWLARDERAGSAGELVALKVLNPLLGADSRRRETILREVRVAERLRHRAIVPVLAGGTERGYAWIATEYVSGETLERALKHIAVHDRMRRAVEIGIDIAEALAHAHEQGVVHRDLKPGNVIVDEAGRAHVLDFGLAQVEGAALTISRTGDVVGTPLYMAPEQARGEIDVGPEADIYALGILLHDVARGEVRNTDLPLASLLARIASGRMRPRGADLRRVPRPLRAIVSRCTELHPDDRYASALQLTEDLRAARDGHELPHGDRGLLARRFRQVRRHPLRAIAAVASLALLVVGAWHAWRTWPVPVFFQEVRGGKELWIDGRQVGTTPLWLSLRPGRHAWRASLNGAVEYAGSLEVRPFETQHVLVALEPPHETPKLPPPFEIHGNDWAWTFLATPYPGLRIDIGGRTLEAPVGFCAVQLPFGRHEIVLRVDGRRDVKRTLDISEQRLYSFHAEPDPVDSPWSTITLYSPLEELVREVLVEQRGLRLFYENSVMPGRRLYVERAYWGPAAQHEDGHVLLRVALAAPPDELRLSIVTGSIAVGNGSWSRLEMGRSPEAMVTVMECREERCITDGNFLFDERMVTPRFEPGEPVVGALLENLRGAREIWVRWSVGGVAAGGSDSALAQALRCNSFPCLASDGQPAWGPAIRLAVRSGD